MNPKLPPIGGPLLGVGLVIAVFLLVGCAGGKLPPTHQPAIAQCDAMCYEPCVAADGDTGVRWTTVRGHDPVPPPAPQDPTWGDPAAWDALAGDVTLPLAEKLRQCDVRRKACVQCLDRLEQQKVIIQ